MVKSLVIKWGTVVPAFSPWSGFCWGISLQPCPGTGAAASAFHPALKQVSWQIRGITGVRMVLRSLAGQLTSTLPLPCLVVSLAMPSLMPARSAACPPPHSPLDQSAIWYLFPFDYQAASRASALFLLPSTLQAPSGPPVWIMTQNVLGP